MSRLKSVVIDDAKHLNLVDALADKMKKESEIAADEVTAVALAQRTGDPVSRCYKFLVRQERAGLLTSRRVKSCRVFKAVTK